MATLGGKREGAGRKKGYAAIEAEKARDYIAKKLAEKLEPIVNALLEKAVLGEIPAVKELFDRGYGKPKESLDVESGGKPLNFKPYDDVPKNNSLQKDKESSKEN